MIKVEQAILTALECGRMTMQELYNKTPYHCMTVDSEVARLVSSGLVKSTKFKLNTGTSQLLEIAHGH